MFFDMFDNPVFSLTGRTARKQYVYFFVAGILYVILLIVFSNIQFFEIFEKSKYAMGILGITIFLPFVILVAQSIQRCHDLGVNGWFQLIPFFILFMLFVEGQNCTNKYGESSLKESTDKITLLNRGKVSVAINKTETFKMFLLFLTLLLLIIIIISLA